MPAPPLPEDEEGRLAALADLNILDTERAADFDIFPALASRLFAAPIAAISLVDRDRQWFKASVGLETKEMPRDVSFCAFALHNPGETLYVPDASKDPRFADNPLVTGDFGLRFYAGVPVVGPSGHPLGAICVIDRRPREVDDAMLAELRRLAVGVNSALRLHATVKEFRDLAFTDPLTGLGNRARHDRALREAIEGNRGRNAETVGLLFLDLDGFKDINDAHGHATGDAALREVARRLRRVVRGHDEVTRFGGDEFCVLARKFNNVADLWGVAARIHAAMADPFRLEQVTLPLRTSIGIAAFPDDGDDAETLTKNADAALYQAKRAGRGMTCFFSPVSLPGHTAAAGRPELAGQLRAALQHPVAESFAVALQPVVQAADGQLVGFEAFARWSDQDGQAVPPDDFIPVAEATGLVAHLDRWMLDRACAMASAWPDRVGIAINLAAATLFAGDLVGDVRAAVARHALARGRLSLEISELALVRDSARVQRLLVALREVGARVVLDTFGEGHAALSHLRDFAFDGVKIDRRIIAAIDTDARGRDFARALALMARALGLEVTAKGVEREAQRDLLRDMGVPLLQGFLLGAPMSAEAATRRVGDCYDTRWTSTVRCDSAENRASRAR